MSPLVDKCRRPQNSVSRLVSHLQPTVLGSMQRVSEPLFCHTLALRLRLLKLLNCVMWEAGQLLTINHYVPTDSERWKIREEPGIRVHVCRFDGWVYTNRKL